MKMVHYAYPTSPMAMEMKRLRGCYYVTTETNGAEILGPLDDIKSAETIADSYKNESYNPIYMQFPLTGSKFKTLK